MFSSPLVALLAANSVSAQGLPAGLLNAVKAITPSIPTQPEHWDGIEFRYNRIVFRPARKALHLSFFRVLISLIHSEFKIEGTLLSLILLYFLLWYIGKANNYRRAMAWSVYQASCDAL